MIESILNAVDRAIWVLAPRASARVSGLLGAIAADGQYVRRLRPLAILLPIAVLVIGLTIGATHSEWFGFESAKRAFSASLSLTIFALLVGACSTHLSLLFLLGYAVGDVIVFQTMTKNDIALGFYAGLILSYLLFAQLICVIPLIARAVGIASVSRITGRQQPMAHLRLVLLLLSAGAAMATLTYIWISAFPYLIRPVHVLTGHWVDTQVFIDGRMAEQTVRPIQISTSGAPSIGHPLIIAGVIALLLRLIIEARWRIDRQPIEAVLPETPRQRWPIFISIPAKAVLSTFIISGLFSHIYQAIITCLTFMALLIATHLGLFQIGNLAKFIIRIPMIVRFFISILLIYFSASIFIPALTFNESAFTPMIVTIIIGTAIVAFLMPQNIQPKKDEAE